MAGVSNSCGGGAWYGFDGSGSSPPFSSSCASSSSPSASPSPASCPITSSASSCAPSLDAEARGAPPSSVPSTACPSSPTSPSIPSWTGPPSPPLTPPSPASCRAFQSRRSLAAMRPPTVSGRASPCMRARNARFSSSSLAFSACRCVSSSSCAFFCSSTCSSSFLSTPSKSYPSFTLLGSTRYLGYSSASAASSSASSLSFSFSSRSNPWSSLLSRGYISASYVSGLMSLCSPS